MTLGEALSAVSEAWTDPTFDVDSGLSGAVRGFVIHKLVECWLWEERLRHRYNEYVESPDAAMLANRRPGYVLC